MTTHTISNIAYKIIEKKSRALYSLHYSCFDAIINSIESVDLCLESSYSYYYDMYIGHNCFEYAQNTINACAAMHIPAVLFFHSNAPQKIKKEDIYILKNTLAKTRKIFCSADIANSWNYGVFRDADVVPYGVPLAKIYKPEKSKDILLINNTNNNQITNLHSKLSNKYKKCDVVSSLTMNSQQNIDILSNYKIVLDIDNTINILCAISSGARVIGSSAMNLSDDFKHFYKMPNYNHIETVIDNIISDEVTEEEVQHNHSILNSNYNYDKFCNEILSILGGAKREAFII